MDWDDEYSEEYDDAMAYDDTDYASHRNESMPDNGGAEGGLDSTDIADPVSAYFFLSEDVQDEFSGSDKKKIKCLSWRAQVYGRDLRQLPGVLQPGYRGSG